MKDLKIIVLCLLIYIDNMLVDGTPTHVGVLGTTWGFITLATLLFVGLNKIKVSYVVNIEFISFSKGVRDDNINAYIQVSIEFILELLILLQKV